MNVAGIEMHDIDPNLMATEVMVIVRGLDSDGDQTVAVCTTEIDKITALGMLDYTKSLLLGEIP